MSKRSNYERTKERIKNYVDAIGMDEFKNVLSEKYNVALGKSIKDVSFNGMTVGLDVNKDAILIGLLEEKVLSDVTKKEYPISDYKYGRMFDGARRRLEGVYNSNLKPEKQIKIENILERFDCTKCKFSSERRYGFGSRNQGSDRCIRCTDRMKALYQIIWNFERKRDDIITKLLVTPDVKSIIKCKVLASMIDTKLKTILNKKL